MFNATKTMQFGFAVTVIAIGAALEFSSLSSAPSSLDNVQVASRYHLRNRTPNFFGRSKTSTTPPASTAPAQPAVRRG